VCGGDRVAMSGGVGAEGGSEGDCGGAGKVGIEMRWESCKLLREWKIRNAIWRMTIHNGSINSVSAPLNYANS